MSRKGVCGRCHEVDWLDRCRGCANWFCGICFDMAGAVSGIKHEKLRPEDTEALDVEEDDNKRAYKVFP